MNKAFSRRKQFRHQFRNKQFNKKSQTSFDKTIAIKEGDELFFYTPSEGGSNFITPNKMIKSSDGKLFSVSPVYETLDQRLAVLEQSLLRRDNLEIEILVKKIESFVSGQSNYTFEELKEFIHKIMSIDDFGTFLEYNRKRIKVTYEAKLFRVIPLIDEFGNFKKDFDPLTWRTAAPNPTLQRLNTEQESVLYTATVDRVAMEEAGITSKNDKFAMFIYKPRLEFELLPIQSNMFLNSKFPQAYQDYGLQVTRMLNEVFSTRSKGDCERDMKVYQLSNYIKQRYLSLNRDKRLQGWSFTSIKFKDAIDYKSDYSTDDLNWLCIALPNETYAQCLDLDDVTCVLFNCTDEDMRILNLSYSDPSDLNSKNKIIRGNLI
ncbi:hypothetical protein [Streptococcus suis]